MRHVQTDRSIDLLGVASHSLYLIISRSIKPNLKNPSIYMCACVRVCGVVPGSIPETTCTVLGWNVSRHNTHPASRTPFAAALMDV